MAATKVTTLSGEDLPGLIECILRRGYKRNESIVEHAQHLNWSERSAFAAFGRCRQNVVASIISVYFSSSLSLLPLLSDPVTFLLEGVAIEF